MAYIRNARALSVQVHFGSVDHVISYFMVFGYPRGEWFEGIGKYKMLLDAATPC